MKQDAFRKIGEQTGLEFAVWLGYGELLFATPDFDVAFRNIKTSETGVDLASAVACARSKTASGDVLVAVKGVGQVERNYARIIAELADIGDGERKEPADKLRMLLTGELDGVRESVLRGEYSRFNFNHYAVCVKGDKRVVKSVRSFLAAMCEKNDIVVGTSDNSLAYYREVVPDDEYSSATEFATVLYENAREEVRKDFEVAAVGTIRSFDEFRESYSKMLFTLDIGKKVSPASRVYAYKDYVLYEILGDEPKEKLEKYRDALLEKNCAAVIADPELMETAEEFMNNSLNVSETSRSMYIHRNTLIYRLDKIEKESGLDLRSFNDAVLLRLINTLIKLTDKK